MLSNKIYRTISTILVIAFLMTLTVKYVFVEDANWQQASAKALNIKVQTGLSQIYWQWQQNGRPKSINYRPENEQETFVIKVNNKGLPIVEKSKEGCLEFLSWFIEKKILSKSLEVTTTYKEMKIALDAKLENRVKNTETEQICQFLYANKIYKYDLNSGLFIFTD